MNTTCNKCGFIYVAPMHSIIPANCPNCFPPKGTIYTTTTTAPPTQSEELQGEVGG